MKPGEDEPPLRCESLTKLYEDGSVGIREVSFHVAAGEAVALLGANGAGKPTTINLLLGFLSPTSGRASVCGFDCWQEARRAREHLAYLPESVGLYLNDDALRKLSSLPFDKQIVHGARRR